MIHLFVSAALLLSQTVPTDWTWTLYEDGGSLVLANEVPDTPRLRATLECEAGTGAATIRLYRFGGSAGFAEMTAGSATATSERAASGDGSSAMGLRVDHPVFAAFAASGRLSVSSGGANVTVTVERPHLAKLRRFGELCAG